MDGEQFLFENRYCLYEFFTQITTLFGGGLASSLPKPSSDKRRDALLELFVKIKNLDSLIGDLIEIILLKHDKAKRGSSCSVDEAISSHTIIGRINYIILQVYECLSQIRGHLEYLAPGFEIMAEEAVGHIWALSIIETSIAEQLGLVPVLYESIADFESRLNEVREKGELARKSLADFIRQEYTWATLGDGPNPSNADSVG